MSNPKTRQTCQASLLKITGVIGGVVTSKDKTKAMPSPLIEKNPARMIKNLIETGVIGGVVTLKDKTAEAKPPCQYDFKKEFLRLPYKTKYVLFLSTSLEQHITSASLQ